jgi:hypothetical protein
MLALIAEDHFAHVQVHRRAWGADKLDEMWTGIHHLQPVGPHPKLQHAIALRLQPLASERGLVPVLGAYDPGEPAANGRTDAWPFNLLGDQASTAALAVEIVPRVGDIERRLSGCAADRVSEVVIINVDARTVDWLALVDGGYGPIGSSRVIDCAPSALVATIEWPQPNAIYSLQR